MAENSHIDAQILQRTNRYGHIHHRTLRELNLAANTIAQRCKAGRLVREHHGVYSVGHSQRSPLARADAAVMACGERCALSHDSAAALYKIRKWPKLPEVSSPLRRERPGIKTHRTTTLKRADIAYVQGIRTTTVARTIADIAPRLTDTELVRAIHEARRNGDLPDEALARLLTNCARATELYDSQEAPSRSIFQHLFKQFLIERDLPMPVFEARWHGFYVDALYQDHKLIVELDGYRDHSEPDRFEQDRLRDALAAELGYITVRITWKRLTRESAELARQLRAIFAQRAIFLGDR